MVKQAQDAQEQARLSKSHLESLMQQLDAVGKELDDQPASLLPASEINSLLAELARWADEQRLAVTGTTAGRPVAMAFYDYVPITLSGEGSYTDLLGYFQRLHRGRGDLGVVSFHVSRMPDHAGVSYEIQLAWYVASDGQGVGDIGDTTAEVIIP